MKTRCGQKCIILGQIIILCEQECDISYEEGVDVTLEHLLTNAGYAGYEGDEWQEPVDPDIRNDPILEVDLKVGMILQP